MQEGSSGTSLNLAPKGENAMVRPNEIREAPFLWIGVDVAKKTFTAAAKSLPDDAVRYPQGQDSFGELYILVSN